MVSDDGTRKILQKDKGIGVMVSAIQSRVFGFGQPLTKDEMLKVNEKRNIKKYVDGEAAILKRGSADKQPLTLSPFYVGFGYGAQSKGYLTYNHFVLQCKDVFHCLSVLYPNHEFHMCVDHSCGHNRQQEDVLNATNMNKYFGGKQ